jgi:hypothetical protein
LAPDIDLLRKPAQARVNAATCQKQLPNVVTAALIVLIENGLTLMHVPRLPDLSQLTPRMLGALSKETVNAYSHPILPLRQTTLTPTPSAA